MNELISTKFYLNKLGKVLCLSLIFGFILVLFLPAEKSYAAIQAQYYVSPTGSDSNSGTLAQPFLTIAKARDQVRTINATMTGDIIVNLLAGDYWIDASIQFNENDSGTNGHNVIYKNYGDLGSARIIGGFNVTGWVVHSGSIYKANVGTGLDLQALYENGQRSVMARQPNSGYIKVDAGDGTTPKKKFRYNSGNLPALSNYTDLQVLVWSGGHNWDTDTIDVTNVNATTRWVTLAENAKRNLANSRYYFKGALELLDQPGEFYYNTTSGWLYYWPRAGAVTGIEIVAPQVTSIISLAGSSETALVKNIQFEGLTLTSANYDNNNSSGTNANIYLTNAENITIKFNKISNSGFDGILLKGYAKNNTIYGNEIKNSGVFGVRLVTPGKTLEEKNKNNEISNNVIESVGELEGFAAGVYLANSGYNEVSYNKITKSPRYGISMKGTAHSYMDASYEGVTVTYANHWDFNPARYNVIKFNDISQTNRDSQDTGIIEAWGAGKYNTIENNRLYNSGSFAIQSGIYLDDDTSYTTVNKNIIYGIVGSSKYSAYIKGVFNTFTNNVFDYTNGSGGMKFNQYGGDLSNNLTLSSNIFFSQSGGSSLFNFQNYAANRIAASDYNIFYRGSGSNNVVGIPGSDTLAQWKTLNSNKYDQHALTSNPQFVNAADHDYTLQSTSPALGLNFQQIDQVTIGLKSDYPYLSNSTLAGNWRFENNASDSSDKLNHGTNNNGSFVSGPYGQAISLNGTNAYVNIPHATSLNFGAPANPFTITAWIKTSAASGPIVSKSRPSLQTHIDYSLELNSGKLQFKRFHQTPDQNDAVYDSDGVSINDNTWHLVAFVNEGATSHKLYVDGQLVETSTTAWSYNDSTSQPLAIGRNSNYTFGTTYFNGSVDEVQIHQTALSATEINELYGPIVEDSEDPSAPTNLTGIGASSSQINLSWTASTDNVGVAGYKIYRDDVEVGTSATTSYSDTGLTVSTNYSYTIIAYDAADNLSSESNLAIAATLSSAHWKLEGNANDSSGQNNHGTNNNGTYVTGIDGQAISLNGTNAYVNIPHEASLNFGAPGNPFTITAWIKTSAASGPIVSKSRPTQQTHMDYSFEINSGKLHFKRWHQSPDQNDFVTDSDGVSINDNTWHMVAFVNEGASSHKLYVDGQLVETGTTTWSYTDSNTQPLTIGKFTNYTYVTSYFTGSIDDVQIHQRALSATEISTLFN
jgi:parallel beta-helix repeat protein